MAASDPAAVESRVVPTATSPVHNSSLQTQSPYPPKTVFPDEYRGSTVAFPNYRK